MIAAHQALFDGVVTAVENGGRRQPTATQLSYTREQAEAIQRLKNARDDYQRLGLQQTATA
jgi:DnaJ homolog subfamily C member 27